MTSPACAPRRKAKNRRVEWSSALPDEALTELFGAAQRRGLIGAASITDHLRHARAYASLLPDGFERAADLGSGAGLPGLVLAHDFPDVTWWLIERAVARADWLRRAVRRLGLANVTIAPLAAQAVGRSEERGRFDVVVARSFAAPLIVAECAAPLLVVGGRLVVSDRSGEDRWPAAELDRFGLAVGGDRLDGARRLRWFRQIRRCPDRYPRASLRRR